MTGWPEEKGTSSMPIINICVPNKEKKNKESRGNLYTESLRSLRWPNPNDEKQPEYKKLEIDERLDAAKKNILLTLQFKAEAIQIAIKGHKGGESNSRRWNITVSSEGNWIYSTNSYGIQKTAFRIIEQDQNGVGFEIVYPNDTGTWSTLNVKSISEVVRITNFINSVKDYIRSNIHNIMQPSMTNGPSPSFNEDTGGNIVCRVLRKDVGSLDERRTILSSNWASLIWLSEVDVKKIVEYLNHLHKQEFQNQNMFARL